jgi:hypothetical protein
VALPASQQAGRPVRRVEDPDLDGVVLGASGDEDGLPMHELRAAHCADVRLFQGALQLPVQLHLNTNGKRKRVSNQHIE